MFRIFSLLAIIATIVVAASQLNVEAKAPGWQTYLRNMVPHLPRPSAYPR